MEPTYHDGDKVFVEKCDSVDVGEVGIFVVNGDVYIKELGNQCLISHNEKYKPIRIGESDSVYCCGRVIGVLSVCRKTPITRKRRWAFWYIDEGKMRKKERSWRDGYPSTFFWRIF